MSTDSRYEYIVSTIGLRLYCGSSSQEWPKWH